MISRMMRGLLTVALSLSLLAFPMTVHADVVQGNPGPSAESQQQVGNTTLQSAQAASGENGVIVSGTGTAEKEESTAVMSVEMTQAAGTNSVADTTGPGGTMLSGYFGGDELMLLANQAASQMESFIITTKNGSVIVIDGGTEDDEAHLKEVLRSKGGHVSAWFITHPHSDHVGAFTKLLNDENSGITIDAVYYHFAQIEWYRQNEEYRAQMVEDCLKALAGLSPSVNHPNVRKGETIQIDDVRVTVMNEPYLFQTNAINNSSVAYRFEMGGKRVLFLGDMGVQAGNSFLNEYHGNLGELKADVVQMSHHGEHGVDKNVYEAVRPSICLWCCPEWLWNNDSGSGVNSGKWLTLEVRGWMRQLDVKRHYVQKDGDQVIR